MKNPTESQDRKNLSLPLSEQYPNDAPMVRTIDTPHHEDLQLYPEEIDSAPIYRCKRSLYPNLSDAQKFFSTLREKYKWRAETAIFRTGMWWCKRGIPTKEQP